MSNIAKRPDGKWRARYRDKEGKQHAKHFVVYKDAEDWITLQRAKVIKGVHVAPSKGKVTFSAYAKEWEVNQRESASRARLNDNALRLHLIPALGTRSLASIKPSAIQSVVNSMSDKGLSPGSVANVYDVLRRVFDAALDDDVIAATPCRRIKLPKRDRTVTPPTAAQVDALIDAVPRRWQVLPMLLSQSGLRIGEALGPRPGDVRSLEFQVLVERQRLQDGSVGPTKSGKSRIVPLSDDLVTALAQHLEEFGGHEWLFTNEVGEPLTYNAWKKVWDAAREKAGAPGVRAHDLRHYAASTLLSRRAPLPMVSAVLGHSSSTVTLRTYAHAMPEDMAAVRALMNEVHGSGTDKAPADDSAGASQIASGD